MKFYAKYLRSASCHVGTGTTRLNLVVGKRRELRTWRAKRHVGDRHRLQARVPLLPHHARDLEADLVPIGVPGPDAVVETGLAARQKRSGLSRNVHNVTRRHDAIAKHLCLPAFSNGLRDAIDRALGIRAAEQALDAQHEGARSLERKTFSEQFRLGVYALRIRRIRFDVRTVRVAVEHEVRAVMHERRPGLLRRACEHPDRERVGIQRFVGFLLGAIDVGIGGAVDDDVRPVGPHTLHHGVEIRDVELRAPVRPHIHVLNSSTIAPAS